MSRVPLAVVGLGFMGSRWARALAEHAGADVRVVCDVREELGRETAAALGARFVADPLEAASDREVGGVAVCTPEHLHVEPALAAIDAGKAVMVEKPLAHSVEDAGRIRDRARERGVPVLAGHILRFEPRYAAARRAIEAGDLGEVQAVRHERIGLVADQEVLRGRTTIPLYYGVHEFDLARWYAGEVERIHAERSDGVLRARGYELEDLYSAVLRFASGAHGTAMLGWSLPARTPGYGIGGVTIIGELGIARVAQGETGLLIVDERGPRDADVYYAPEVHGRLRGALAIEADHFVAVARGEIEPLCTAADGTEAVRISLAMEASAARGEPVELVQAGR
jgi:predicted dehydrogenase